MSLGEYSNYKFASDVSRKTVFETLGLTDRSISLRVAVVGQYWATGLSTVDRPGHESPLLHTMSQIDGFLRHWL